MTSSMKSKLAQATGYSTPDTSLASEEAEKYRLLVTAGGSYNLKDHKTINVNTDTPTFIENEFLRAKINVRVRGFRGLPNNSPSTAEYFEHPMHKKDQYSLGFSFVPKQDLPSLHAVWGNDLDHPVRDKIPPGFNTAFKIVKEFIDPGLSCDVYADEPWMYGPSLSCWFALRIGDDYTADQDFPAPGAFAEGADGSGEATRERLNLPSNNEKRRKHFLDAAHREAFTFEKGRLYQGDFFNPYLDFANFALKLPGFSLKVVKYIGDKTHCLRYVFKNRETGDVYFNVNFTLLWGEQLEKALEQDGKGGELGGVEVNGSHDTEERSPKGGDVSGVPVNGSRSTNAPSTEGGGVSRLEVNSKDEQPETARRVDKAEKSTRSENDGIQSDRQDDATIGAMRLHPGDMGALAEHNSTTHENHSTAHETHSTARETHSTAHETQSTAHGQLELADGYIMRLHPEDHATSVEQDSNQTAVDEHTGDQNGVDEIDRLLKETSTDQKRGGLMLDEID